MGLNSCYVVLKYLVILINLIFWVTGLGILALSIWLLTDPSAYISVTQDEASFKSGIYVLLAIGILILIVGILGCCGACSESQCLLISFIPATPHTFLPQLPCSHAPTNIFARVYCSCFVILVNYNLLFFCILLVVVAAEIAAGAWAYTNKEELNNLVKVSFQKTVEEEYGIIKSRTITVDTIQQELHCCGANGPNDWANSQYNSKKDKLDLSVSSVLQHFEIPPSCCKGDKDDVLCKTGRIGQGTLPISPVIFQDGCIAKVYEYLEGCMPIIIGVIIAIVLLEILGLILSLILCCAVRFVDRYKA